jgi:O-methyltransferase
LVNLNHQLLLFTCNTVMLSASCCIFATNYKGKIMGVYNLLNIILIVTLIAFSVYYIWDWIKGSDRLPVSWAEANKRGLVSEKLIKIYRSYPDKSRFMMIWLQMQRLDKESIKGDIAELGVYRGETAALLHALAHDRDLHLFDTYSGFRQDDLANETGEAATYTTANFADTSVEFVQNRLGYSNKIHYHDGNFADIAAKLPPIIYAFASLDADLAKPTADGLVYFYQHLAPGGVILVHDYNPKWPGLMKAVDEFLVSIPEKAVFMPDINGSVVITKNKA